MVLKYRGFNKNWCFVEGDSIVTARVETSGIKTQSEVPGVVGDCYKELQNKIGEETEMWNVRFIGEVLKYPVVTVVSVGKDTFAFATSTATEVFILNDNGKTIERLI